MTIKAIVRRAFFTLGFDLVRHDPAYPISRSIDTKGVELLADAEFQASCEMLGNTTLLDTPRLANLWMLCRITDPTGAIAEIGTYRGGGALHLSNCCPERLIVVCDPFSQENFERLDPELDKIFSHGQFPGASEQEVRNLFRHRRARIIPGYFPDSVRNSPLPKLSFVHLDVDVYEATRRSLEFLLMGQVLCDRSLIVLDDYNRKADGVLKAVKEVLEIASGTSVFPLFPGQALIVPSSWRRSA